MSVRWILFLCASVFACAPVRTIAPVDSPARETSALRKLSLKESIEVVEEDRESINRGREKLSSFGGFWSPELAMFGLALSRAELEKLEPESSSGLAGYFDYHQRRIHVDASLPKGRVYGVLSHELGHALQHDAGLLEKIWGYNQEDELNTDGFYGWKALIEGDPTLIERAVSDERTLEEVLHESIRTAKIPLDERLRFFWGRDSVGKEGRLPLPAHYLFYQYTNGVGFVAEIVRAGGIELLTKVYKDPPRSTEHVLHPEKYLSGDDPILIPMPSAPEGFGRIASGSHGELGTRAVLNACYPLPYAIDMATGWGGDSYAIVRGQKKELVLLWSMVWDDEPAAARFASELERCWKTRKPSSWAARPTLRVVVRGDRVFAIRGLPERMIDAAIEEMAAAQHERPAPKRRFPDVEIPPPAELPALAKIDGSALADEYLGVSAKLPAPCRVDAGHYLDGRIQVRCEKKGSASFGIVSTADEKQRAAAFDRAAMREIGEKLGPSKEERPFASGLGEGTEKSWRTAEERTVRVTLIPACGGGRAFSFAEVYETEKEGELLDDWRASFTLTSPAAAACADPR